MTRRTLSLQREALTELAADDLTRVAGAAVSGVTCPLKDCINDVSENLTCPQRCYGTYNCPTNMC